MHRNKLVEIFGIFFLIKLNLFSENVNDEIDGDERTDLI